MTKPVVAQTSPYTLELEPGTYWWCRCGLSQNQPFCDGSHKPTDITPVKFDLDKTTTVSLCGCKQSANTPFCDGSHNKI